MSSAQMDGDERPRREVAHRIFAAEFDDATLSYSESDEERAPNYVVTPTGARANRLFAAGVLTELDELGNGQLRARIVDPTGAFVVYAGQYQPDALAALERLSPPAFVAITGKARTFQPEDSNRVFTSIRPETISEIDATTRDRWTVETAARTLDRVGEFASTLAENGAGGHEGTPIASGEEGPGSGISLAREHYGTTPAYLAAVRELALDAARLVAGDTEEVAALDFDPGEAGDVDLAALTDSPLGGTTVATIVDGAEGGASASTADEPEPANAEPIGSGADAMESTHAATSTESTRPDESPVETETQSESEREAATPESDDALASDAEAGGADGDGASEPATTVVADDGTGIDDLDTSDIDDGSENEDDDSGGDSEDDAEEFDGEEFDLSDEERAEIEAEYGTDFATGSEVDDPGEADIEPTAPPVEEDGADGAPTEDDTAAEPVGAVGASEDQPDTGGEAVETEADTGTDIGVSDVDPGETADPDVEPGQAADEPSDEGTDSDDADDDSETEEDDGSTAQGSESDAVEATDEDTGDIEDTTDAAEVDVTEAVMDAMRELDDGDGAEREAVIERVSDEHGIPASDVDDAIEDALMGGQCYEPGDGTLKAI